MKVGILLESNDAAGQTEERLIEYARVADENGFSTVWIPEQHFSTSEPLPSPFCLGAAVAAETHAVRIGTFVKLALHHPLAVAEDAAVLDLICGGRLIIAADPGGTEEEFRGYGVPFAGRWERFCEAHEIVRKAWTSDGFAYAGKLQRIPLAPRALPKSAGFSAEPYRTPYVLPWKRAGMPFEYLSVLPKPAQLPHPPVFMVGADAEGVSYAARKGCSLFLRAHDPALEMKAKRYWEEIAHAGRGQEEVVLAVAAEVHIEENGDKARARLGATGGHALAGSPEEIFDGIKKLQQKTGLTHFVCAMSPPGLAPEAVVAALELFSAQVATRLEM